MNTDYTRIERFKLKLKAELTEKRYEHTLRTVCKAMELAAGTEADRDVVFYAALLHDCAKYKTPDEAQKAELRDFFECQAIIHAPFGAIIARDEYGIADERVLNAIKYHSTGRAGMALEEMIVCLADAIEDGRDYPNLINVREFTKIGIKQGLLANLKGIIEFEASKGNKIHYLTLEAISDLEKREDI